MHIKIDEICNLFLYFDSELPENMGVCVCMLSHIRLSAILWTVAHQAPLSMGFPRRE